MMLTNRERLEWLLIMLTEELDERNDDDMDT
jgi:hypothetical protein